MLDVNPDTRSTSDQLRSNPWIAVRSAACSSPVDKLISLQDVQPKQCLDYELIFYTNVEQSSLIFSLICAHTYLFCVALCRPTRVVPSQTHANSL